MREKARLGAASWLLLLSFLSFSQAVPVERANRWKRNDDIPIVPERVEVEFLPESNATLGSGAQGACTVGDIVYQVGENVPGRSPCERCVCTGQTEDDAGVSCQDVQCEVRAGCKALHRADHCCPLYQCECERNGTIYSNGEKLEDPQTPCQVCYCQGGEIVCNQIACFRRNDCEPVYVAGSCCPEYDHCPPSDKDMEKHYRPKDGTTSKINLSGDNSYLGESSENSGNYLKNSEDTKKEPPVSELSNDSYDINQKLDIPKINIKEVYNQGKPLINEIRIKEILPSNNVDVLSISTKAPTFPREISSQNIDNSNNNENFKPEIQDNKKAEDDSSQSPQVLRIGDQLLFLKLGDLVPENASISTPSPVFTVIGAEGLQRVVDEPEESFDQKNINTDPVETTKVSKTSQPDQKEETFENPINSPSQEKEIKTNENNSKPENLDELLQETISLLYETTTMEPLFVEFDSNNSSSTRYFDNKIYESTSTAVNLNTKDPQVSDRSNSDHLDDEQTVPIEHLPEHNPEYPPLPEDIMILTMTEDSLELGSSEIEFSGANPIESNLELRNDEKIVVKRPVIPLTTSKLNKHNTMKDQNTEKILPDILPLIRNNKTNEENNTNAPEEWLKANEKLDVPTTFNSPLLTLESALPESILMVSSKTSTEEDDSNEYIFVNNKTFHGSAKAAEANKPESTTDDSLGLTDAGELEGEFRSPGEPYLIPEWERNQTTDQPDTYDNFTENNDVNTSIASESTTGSENYTNIDENSVINEKYSSPNEISNENDVSTVPIDIQSTEYLYTKQNTLYETSNISNDIEPTGTDDIKNLIISTENSIDKTSTQKITSNEKLETDKPKGLMPTEIYIKSDGLDSYDDAIYPQKQKKTSALVDNKNDDSGIKRNILADLINLVGDVANIGNHENEVSTVLNNIDHTKTNQKTENNFNIDNDFIPFDNQVTNSDLSSIDNLNVELTEYNASGDKTDLDIITENEKVEFTTPKILIDKETDGKNKWKVTEAEEKEIEIIPRVDNKKNKFDPAHEKIIKETSQQNSSDNPPSGDQQTQENNINNSKSTLTNKSVIDNKQEDVIIYTTIQTSTVSPVVNKKINDAKNKTALKNEFKDTETLISVDDSDGQSFDMDDDESGSTENSYKSTIMKVTGKVINSDDQIYDFNSNEGEKLRKRETNSQLIDSAGQIDDSVLSILRHYFEQRFIH